MPPPSPSVIVQESRVENKTSSGQSLLYTIYAWLVDILWPVYKWFVHQCTGCCELVRIARSQSQTLTARVNAIEQCLCQSKHAALRDISNSCDLCHIDEYVSTICKLKGIKSDVDERSKHDVDVISDCLSHIVSYNDVITRVESLRATMYNSDNTDHEHMLIQLWKLMLPDSDLPNRVGKHWTQLGFQGEDPKTDFRGMGMLGLTNLLYFARHDSSRAKQVLSRSHHPQYWFSYAIVGIDITSMLYHLLIHRYLTAHLYNVLAAQNGAEKSKPVTQTDMGNGRRDGGDASISSEICGRKESSSITPDSSLIHLTHIHQLFCYLFAEFSIYWVNSKPRDIMEFNRVRDEFCADIKGRLATDPNVLLSYEGEVDGGRS